MHHAVRPHLKKLILWAAPLAWLACGGDGGTDIVLPSLSITTATTGAELDPDGYSVQIDGAAAQPIGLQATVTVDRLTDGPHTVELLGVAPNCSAGANPRTVAITSGATASVAFAVVCGATTGNLEVVTATSGQPADPDGFVIVLDGDPRNPIGPTATVTFPGIATGLHTVELSGVAPNCQVTGDHPLGVAIEPGETGRVSFAINCVATAGELAVTVSGLPTGTPAAVTVSGPNSFSAALTGTGSLTGLAPGTYTVAATSVAVATTTYTPSIGRPTVDVVAGGTVTVTVSYTAVANLTLNLGVEGLYLTQSIQTFASDVPLVAGRAGYLRVFVVANENNTVRPAVRVRFRNGSSVTERTINAPSSSTPTTVQEGTLGSSWNLPVDAALIQPGLSVEATVDPAGSIAESNESDNHRTKTLAVRTVPTARIRFVSVVQGTSAAGNVSEGNKDFLIGQARRLYPLSVVDVDVHSSVFTASAPLLPGTNGNGDGWSQLLTDLHGLRVTEESDRTYFGIVKLTYGRSDGLVGLAFEGDAAAAGWDDPADVRRVVAHELGHTWGRRHSPCGNPPAGSVDGLYPSSGLYAGGRIGVFGLDVASLTMKLPSAPDIMGYCTEPAPWISDYTYKAVMDFRAANATAVLAEQPQPSLLIWGRIVKGRPVLEPAFEIVTRPSLPSRPGPYSVTATGVDGSRLFSLSFDVAAVEDQAPGSGHFAFAVPLDEASASRLAGVRLDGPSGGTGNSRAPAQLRAGPTSESIVARREGENVSLRWNAAAHPMIMVRDPDTGEVLSFARGGSALVRTAKDVLELDVSDGVRSQRVRLAISRS